MPDGNRRTCDECGGDQFYVLMAVGRRGRSAADPRRPSYDEVVDQVECVECGATYSA